MTWIKMADQKPHSNVRMLTRHKNGQFSTGKFDDMSEGETAYRIFVCHYSCVWAEDDITHWALVELPAE